MSKTQPQSSLLDNLLKRQRAAVATSTPFVSVVCPSYNRREFLPYLLYIFQYQDYPADKRELIILDDSERSNQDLIDMMVDGGLQNVRYIHSKERLALGRKRNMLNEMAQGEYIICFDDDDYYPPNKLSYQVREMQSHKALFSGSDQIYVWYSHLDKIYLTNSFGANHALNGTFGLHRNLLKKNRYEDDAMLAEEQAFLRGFTTPVLQIDPKQAIVCISHSANTYDKDFILGSSTPVDLRLEDLVEDQNLLAHYRRLSRAPLNTAVLWSAFGKVAVIYDPLQEEALMQQCEELVAFGIPAEKLLPVARQQHTNAKTAELKTHISVLEQAQQQGWENVLLLDASVRFVKKESSVNLVNALLSQLSNIDWHVLLLGARYNNLRPMASLKGVARIYSADCGIAYAVNGNYIPVLLESYRLALGEEQSRDRAWNLLMPQHCWLGFYPAFAFVQRANDETTGRETDCTHWFFRKHS
ncbi:glycosyltransferase [Enterobacteriaceae bacterium H18W14]|uniref:glycosyltransferase family 2 protein n=1 Tax=Dryocola boscaweniae TaxID=2925397 RepID=UPI0022F02310|nr:glycosyltransferase family 2 protein [Dryocola boscaweniae]MCT4716215.1 glycosyltransferase [Dryocola boscaweniae]